MYKKWHLPAPRSAVFARGPGSSHEQKSARPDFASGSQGHGLQPSCRVSKGAGVSPAAVRLSAVTARRFFSERTQFHEPPTRLLRLFPAPGAGCLSPRRLAVYPMKQRRHGDMTPSAGDEWRGGRLKTNGKSTLSSPCFPLCPAGHLPHKGGDNKRSSGHFQIRGGDFRRGTQSVRTSCLQRREAFPHPVSPLVGEMPGRAEGDIHHRPLPYSNSIINSSTARLWPALTATFFTTLRFSALRMFSIFMASTVASA